MSVVTYRDDREALRAENAQLRRELETAQEEVKRLRGEHTPPARAETPQERSLAGAGLPITLVLWCIGIVGALGTAPRRSNVSLPPAAYAPLPSMRSTVHKTVAFGGSVTQTTTHWNLAPRTPCLFEMMLRSSEVRRVRVQCGHLTIFDGPTESSSLQERSAIATPLALMYQARGVAEEVTSAGSRRTLRFDSANETAVLYAASGERVELSMDAWSFEHSSPAITSRLAPTQMQPVTPREHGCSVEGTWEFHTESSTGQERTFRLTFNQRGDHLQVLPPASSQQSPGLPDERWVGSIDCATGRFSLRHPYSETNWLWLGRLGPLGGTLGGTSQLLEQNFWARRTSEAPE